MQMVIHTLRCCVGGRYPLYAGGYTYIEVRTV